MALYGTITVARLAITGDHLTLVEHYHIPGYYNIGLHNYYDLK